MYALEISVDFAAPIEIVNPPETNRGYVKAHILVSVNLQEALVLGQVFRVIRSRCGNGPFEIRPQGVDLGRVHAPAWLDIDSKIRSVVTRHR